MFKRVYLLNAQFEMNQLYARDIVLDRISQDTNMKSCSFLVSLFALATRDLCLIRLDVVQTIHICSEQKI